MRFRIFLAAAAVCAALSGTARAEWNGELVATGADMRTWTIGEVGGSAATNLSVGITRTICPWKVYVTNAVRRSSSTSSVFTPTNYVVKASVTLTNAIPKWADFTRYVTNTVFLTDAASTNLAFAAVTNVWARPGSRYTVTNVVTTATVTNRVPSLAGIAAPWQCVATNGVTATVTNLTTTAAGGTVTLKTSLGSSWEVSLSGGSGSYLAGWPDMSDLAFPGDLTVTASQAQRFDLRIIFLTFER